MPDPTPAPETVTIAITGTPGAIKAVLPALITRFPEMAPVQEVELESLSFKTLLRLPDAGNVRVQATVDVLPTG